jgi:hypothetical protein
MTAPAGVDVGTIAGLLNVTPRRVQQLANDGIIPRASRGNYSLIGCVRGYIKFLQTTTKGGAPATVASEIAQIRLERQRLSLQRDRLDFDHDAGALVAIEDATAQLGAIVEAMRTTLQLAPKRYGLDAEDRARLKRVCTETLTAALDAAERAVRVLEGEEAEPMGDVALDDAAAEALEELGDTDLVVDDEAEADDGDGE